MELKINNNKKKGKFTTMWKLNNIILNNHWVKKESKGNLKSIFRQMKTKAQCTKTYGVQLNQY